LACARPGFDAADAVAIMAERKISELPVVDADSRPLGLIDITDVVALLPTEALPDIADLPGRQKHPSLPIPAPLRVIHEPEAGEEA
jgi:arabinose-5-phosphate isomerase